MESLGISSSFKPINREFLFYHRDKEHSAQDDSNIEKQKGEVKSIATEICSTLNEIPNKLTEFPIILIDKRDNEIKRKNSDSKIEHPYLQLFDKKYPPVTYTLNSFMNCMNDQNNNNNNNNASNHYQAAKKLNKQENPLYLLNLMKSKNRELSYRCLDSNFKQNLTASNSMVSYCEMVNAADMIKNSKKYNEKFYQPDVFQKKSKKNILFDSSSTDLSYKKSSLKDFMVHAENYSNQAKSYLIKQNEYDRKFNSSQQEFALRYINSLESVENEHLYGLNNNNNNNKSATNNLNFETNLMKASRLHQNSMKERKLEPSVRLISNETDLYPYATDETVLFKKMMKQHKNIKNTNSNQLVSGRSNYSLALEITVTTLKNLLLIFLLLFFIWPLTIFIKFCSINSKHLAKIFPNLEDVFITFDRFYVKLLYYEEKLMDNISFKQ